MIKDTTHWINQGEINTYLQEVRKHKALTKNEEIKLIELIQGGCEKSKEKLIYSNLRFVISMAKQYQHMGLSLSDLISEGNYGLVKAALRFDFSQKDVRFLSYAVWWVKQSIIQCLMEHSRTIRLPANVVNDLNKLKKEQTSDDNFNYESLNDKLGLPTMSYLDAPIGEDGGDMYGLIEGDEKSRPDVILEENQEMLLNALRRIMVKLSHPERYVISNYFGLEGHAMTLQDISEELELTKERVRQIKERGIKKLRFYSKELFNLL